MSLPHQLPMQRHREHIHTLTIMIQKAKHPAGGGIGRLAAIGSTPLLSALTALSTHLASLSPTSRLRFGPLCGSIWHPDSSNLKSPVFSILQPAAETGWCSTSVCNQIISRSGSLMELVRMQREIKESGNVGFRQDAVNQKSQNLSCTRGQIVTFLYRALT